jgi:hypothetical protein
LPANAGEAAGWRAAGARAGGKDCQGGELRQRDEQQVCGVGAGEVQAAGQPAAEEQDGQEDGAQQQPDGQPPHRRQAP